MALASLCHAAASAPRTRRFQLDYKTIVKDVPAGVKRLELWIPVPTDDPHQGIANLRRRDETPVHDFARFGR